MMMVLSQKMERTFSNGADLSSMGNPMTKKPSGKRNMGRLVVRRLDPLGTSLLYSRLRAIRIKLPPMSRKSQMFLVAACSCRWPVSIRDSRRRTVHTIMEMLLRAFDNMGKRAILQVLQPSQV